MISDSLMNHFNVFATFYRSKMRCKSGVTEVLKLLQGTVVATFVLNYALVKQSKVSKMSFKKQIKIVRKFTWRYFTNILRQWRSGSSYALTNNASDHEFVPHTEIFKVAVLGMSRWFCL